MVNIVSTFCSRYMVVLLKGSGILMDEAGRGALSLLDFERLALTNEGTE